MSKLLKLNLKIIKFSAPIDTSMRKILFIVFLFFACSNPDNHGDLSIFKIPTTDQFDKWSNIDSVYKSTIKEMVDVYKKSGKLNFNGNPWDNKKFQSKYSDLTWRGLYDYYQYFTEVYNDLGFEEGEILLDSLNNRFDQLRDDLIIWKEE